MNKTAPSGFSRTWQLCQRCGVTRRQILYWAAIGLLNPYHVSRSVFIFDEWEKRMACILGRLCGKGNFRVLPQNIRSRGIRKALMMRYVLFSVCTSRPRTASLIAASNHSSVILLAAQANKSGVVLVDFGSPL